LPGEDLHPSPARVGADLGWTERSAGAFHTCGLTGATLRCWGRNIEGQLATGDLSRVEAPRVIGEGFTHVAVGRFFTCITSTDARVFCAGLNLSGMLGIGTNAADSGARFLPVTELE